MSSAIAVLVAAPAPDAHSETLSMSRIGARTDRPKSTIEARGALQVDDIEDFLDSVEAHGLSARFEYTDTVSDDGFADGDIIAGTEFTWAPAVCRAASNLSSVICNDKVRKTYVKFKRDKKAEVPTFKLRAYVRQIEPPLVITPGFGERLRFVLEWDSIAAGPVTLAGEMDRCDWKRGKKRTTRHVKCPTLCGGSPLAVCGSNYCVGAPKCN